MDYDTIRGDGPARLSNAISDAIHAALDGGMDTAEVVCITVSVAADYARIHYGNGYLPALASIVTSRAGMPLPTETQ